MGLTALPLGELRNIREELTEIKELLIELVAIQRGIAGEKES